ncbi:MAG: glutamate synthase large subunit [Propionibacterium sp.]|nr:glutamate synthase large subunit [Propionibacterium sp.]
MTSAHAPRPIGLYDPLNEHDACGVAFVAMLDGVPRHSVVTQGLEALRNLDHRGATGADGSTGDGAGILVQIPDEFLRHTVEFPLPEPGAYAVGTAYLPEPEGQRRAVLEAVEALADELELDVLGVRDLPTERHPLSELAAATMPHMAQVFVGARDGRCGIALDRATFVLRRRIQHEAGTYVASLSARTLVYKGMLTPHQLGEVFPDLTNERFRSALAVVHSRFSTNTFPSWELAQPFRTIAHNGEINTVRGNRNWMRAREALLGSDLFPGDLGRLSPICGETSSDSGSFDEVLELLHLGGRSLPHALMMMVPEAWEHDHLMDAERRAFFEYHSLVMEPWDGPASIVFTDGTTIGATLDRNGLRPGRYAITSDGLVVFGSEAGVLPLDESRIRVKGRLQPGRMFLADLQRHELVPDDEIKAELARAAPYGEWLEANRLDLDELPARAHVVHSHSSVQRRQQSFGYTDEEVRLIIAPMADDGAEAIGAMGTDTPVAAISGARRSLFDHFQQLFAQVTNPPLDSIREELVTSLTSRLGAEGNLLDPTPASARQIMLPRPILDSGQLAKIVHLREISGHASHVVHALYEVDGGAASLGRRLEEIFAEASGAIERGASVIVVSDRDADARRAPIPSLLLTAGLHHHLVRQRTRSLAGIVVEAGDVREVHHAALLIAYGAAAVNPYLLFESAEDLARRGRHVRASPDQAIGNVTRALCKGLLKVMSKMGVSTVASYTGAQLFQTTGLGLDLIERHFTGTTSQIGGITLDDVAAEIRERHDEAYPPDGVPPRDRRLRTGGEYQWRRGGERHLFDPETIFRLQHATRTGDEAAYRRFSALVDRRADEAVTLRSLLRLAPAEAIPVDEVEPVEAILARFSTGAMSYGSISQEAHETLAVAMNRIGARSNTGEGGEDSDRLHDPARRSAVKQVASGRFGVTSDYLAQATDIQIKMAQGAKPGEGGQLPGHKVYPWIAKTRHSTPGVGLISPPPHHDIYSIEDLKQLIHDLKCANPMARIHVKLASETGVGTVAAGAVKAKADVVLVSGHDGGTGAAAQSSIKHAGTPWELGLAEVQQTLLLNGLRDRVVVQVDGQLRTGRDVVVAALLGAEEFGFATAPLVVSGCVMMRVCHKDTCPVGIATQDPELRKHFTGKPEHVVNYFRFVAGEVRELLARLGLRSLEEAVGRVDLLDADDARTHGLDLSPVLVRIDTDHPRSHRVAQDHGLDDALDVRLIELARPALEDGRPVRHTLEVRNVQRTVGTMLGHAVTRATEGRGLDPGTIEFTLRGTGGQSFGAFLPRGVTLRLLGEANDYLGKGLSGGTIVVAPPPGAGYDPHAAVVAGNVIGYGATSGRLFLSGTVGERFLVRNSGATGVVEGVGDHGLEYMTGGEALILGPTGRNLAAGMSGGVAWVLDLDERRLGADVGSDGVDDGDLARIFALLREHVGGTGSRFAASLLDLRAELLGRRMRKVAPHG